MTIELYVGEGYIFVFQIQLEKLVRFLYPQTVYFQINIHQKCVCCLSDLYQIANLNTLYTIVCILHYVWRTFIISLNGGKFRAQAYGFFS